MTGMLAETAAPCDSAVALKSVSGVLNGLLIDEAAMFPWPPCSPSRHVALVSMLLWPPCCPDCHVAPATVLPWPLCSPVHYVPLPIMFPWLPMCTLTAY